MSTLYIFAKGRLGNQLFHFAFSEILKQRWGWNSVLDCYRNPWVAGSPLLPLRKMASYSANYSPWLRMRVPDIMRRRLGSRYSSWLESSGLAISYRDEQSEPDLARELSEGRLLPKDGSLYLNGWWQDGSLYEPHREMIQSKIKFPTLDSRSHAIAREIESHSNAVALVVRGGDYRRADVRKVMGNLGIDYYHRAIRIIRDHVPSPRFYLFTDDLPYAKTFLSPLGLDYKTVSVSPSRHPVTELDLMRRCSHFVLANSTFCWWAEFLSPKPWTEQVTVAPQRWFAEWEPRILMKHFICTE